MIPAGRSQRYNPSHLVLRWSANGELLRQSEAVYLLYQLRSCCQVQRSSPVPPSARTNTVHQPSPQTDGGRRVSSRSSVGCGCSGGEKSSQSADWSPEGGTGGVLDSVDTRDLLQGQCGHHTPQSGQTQACPGLAASPELKFCFFFFLVFNETLVSMVTGMLPSPLVVLEASEARQARQAGVAGYKYHPPPTPPSPLKPQRVLLQRHEANRSGSLQPRVHVCPQVRVSGGSEERSWNCWQQVRWFLWCCSGPPGTNTSQSAAGRVQSLTDPEPTIWIQSQRFLCEAPEGTANQGS